MQLTDCNWVPESFANHIFICYSIICQGLTPDRVESVAKGLGAELVGLEEMIDMLVDYWLCSLALFSLYS